VGRVVVAVAIVVALGACVSSSNVTETRMLQAPARETSCTLAFVQVDLTSTTFNQTWDVLGYVTLSSPSSADPLAEDNRKVARPRACAMGGTSIGVAIAASTAGGTSIAYIVLRPKQVHAAPTTF
jgi:hypothetical protein